MLNGMIVEPVDNVVVAIEPVKKGETVTYMCAGEEKRLTAAEDITIYHKLAACDSQRPAHRQVRRAHRPGGPGHQGRRARALPQPGRAPGKPGQQGLRRRIRV